MNNKYEVVFLEEGIENEDDEDDENLVENTKQSSSKVALKPNDYISVDCVPKTGQGSIKKRIAHVPGNDVSIEKKPRKFKTLFKCKCITLMVIKQKQEA